jgi:hypothetical protein
MLCTRFGIRFGGAIAARPRQHDGPPRLRQVSQTVGPRGRPNQPPSLNENELDRVVGSVSLVKFRNFGGGGAGIGFALKSDMEKQRHLPKGELSVVEGSVSDRERQKDKNEEEQKTTSRAARAAKLTDRDKDLLGLLVLARYLTAAQVHRLAFPGKHASVPYRRLLKLAQTNGQPAFLRQRFFRTYDGNRVAVWTPTAYAMAAALTRAPQLPDLPRHDVGAQFLEHLVQMNELLLALWQNGTRCPRAAHPSFRWVPSDRVRLVWEEWEMREGRKQQRLIQPDAVLELPVQRRRYFLECEMGTQKIAPGESNAPGATLSKADRYRAFLSGGSVDEASHYRAQYPDGFAPEVLFLVLNDGRAESVNNALAMWRAKNQQPRTIAFRALTFESAVTELRRLVGLAPLGADGRAVAEQRNLPLTRAVSAEEVTLLSRCVYDAVRSIKHARAVFRQVRRPDLPPYPDTYEAAAAVLERLTRAG